MSTYVLNTVAMRAVKKNERGVVVKRKKFKRGDVVTADDLVEGRFDALVESGSLVTQEDFKASQKRATAEPEPVDPGSESDKGYEDWDYDLLKAAVTDRNADRDAEEQIEPESQKKKDIIAALKADDEAHPADEADADDE